MAAAVEVFAASYRDRGAADASSRLYRDFLTREVPETLLGAFRGRRLEVPTRLLYGRRDPLGRAMAEGMLRAARGEVPENVVNKEVLDRPAFKEKLGRFAENRP